MTYVALIRGINVGGNSMVKMSDLKGEIEKIGFTNVLTYINSGNVLFESDRKEKADMEKTLEHLLDRTFHVSAKVVVRTEQEIKKTLEQIPAAWKTKEYRCYIAFVKDPMTPKEVAAGTHPKEGIDSVRIGPGAVYLATKMSGIMKTGFTKLIGTPVYQYMTMRNLNTLMKLDALLSR